MSTAITFGATITGGIQDIAGLLPLLGTQQCEEHIGSALTKGYLYAAATPMSIFGSLGVARAGLKTFIACMSGRTWSGATILADMGFEPKGTNLSLIMIDKNDKDGRHLAETRLDELLKELHIDKSRVAVSHKCTRWNVTMILLTALLSSLSMIPYVHINFGGSNLTHFSQWTFPILRAVGGFLTASMMQIVIERRISRLTACHLAKFNTPEALDRAGENLGEVPGNTSNVGHPPVVDVAQESQEEAITDPGALRIGHGTETGDVEKGLSVPDASCPASDNRPNEGKPDHSIHSQHDMRTGIGALDWIILILLLTGILSSVVGYVGCFSVVQNANLRSGPLSWLCLEGGLSAIRMFLWGLNPKGDDAPPVELVLKLDHDTTFLPTCNLDDAHIMNQKVLPLTRGIRFLNMITSFAGLVERFSHPDLTLYYTLTRKQSVISSGDHSSPAHQDAAGKRVLYITIFDHKERTTRVYVRDGTAERFYSTESDVPLIDLRHGLLETKLDKEIISKDDMIAGDPEIHSLLRAHHQSIMDQIHFTVGENHKTSTSTPLPPAYTIENTWTIKAADTVGTRERRRHEETAKQGLGRTWESAVERGRTLEIGSSEPTFERDCLYLEQGRIGEMRQSLDAAHGHWIEAYMELVAQETRDRLDGETAAQRRVDGEPAESERLDGKKAIGSYEELHPVVEEGLLEERCLMEKLLVYEVEAWEGLVWSRVQEFMGRNDVQEFEKERLTREWRGNCWKRLDANIRALDARMEGVKAEISALPNNELQRTLNSKFKEVHEEIRRAWHSVIERFIDTAPPSASSTQSDFSLVRISKYRWPEPSPAQQERDDGQYQEAANRLKKELADVEFRLAEGLDHCDPQIFEDLYLLRCRHSRSKELYLNNFPLYAPLDFYTRALKGNDNVIYVFFFGNSDEDYAWFAQTISDMPAVTSIEVNDPQRLPPIQRDTPLFIDDGDPQSLETFIINEKSLARTRNTYIFMKNELHMQVIAVSFIGPSSGNLILRLKHHDELTTTTLTVLGTSFTLIIPAPLTADDINLRAIDESNPLFSFTPNTRNNLILRISKTLYYTMNDLQLLDEDGNEYRQPSQRKFSAPGTSDDSDSSLPSHLRHSDQQQS